MPTIRRSVLTKEYVRVKVAASLPDGTVVNPTATTVRLAFTAPGVDPVTNDWQTTTTWATVGSSYYAQCLVGPGAVVLVKGRYRVMVKVTDNPEVPAIDAGTLSIY